YAHFNKPPPNPPPPPSPEVTEEIMIRSAQEKLGMDIVNHYNIAICGGSGSGKSSFINCIRGVADVELSSAFIYIDTGSAPSGINETTQAPACYRWPNNELPYLSLWDLPGGGTQKHPAETYFEDKTLYAFDCLLLLKAGRFTSLDVQIFKKAVEYKMPIAVVMTKADQDINNRTKTKARELGRKLTKDEYKSLIEETIRMLKNNAKEELISAGCAEPTLNAMFVVSAISYRDEKMNLLDDNDCPSLETEKVFLTCCNITVYRRNTA
ncbi:unnamed protein product, partial [Didymodactylos carnosus]